MVEVGQFFFAFPFPGRPKNQSLCREYASPRDEEKNCINGWIGSNARFGPVLDIQVCKAIGSYSGEVQVPSLFKDQTSSWIFIVNGVEKYVREAMPIQEEDRASGRPAAKAKPIIKPSSISNPNFIRMKDGRWIDIEVQKSKDQSCYQMSKFITNLLRHKEIGREEDVGVPFVSIVEKCKVKLSKDSRYWSNEENQNLEMAPHWSAQKWIDVLAKGGGQKKRFQYCLKPDDPGRLLYLRAIQGHSGRARSGNAPIDPVLEDNVLLPMNFTKYVCHVGHGNELRSIVHNGLMPGRFITKTGRYAVFFTVVDPMDDEQGSRETFCDSSEARISRHTKILGIIFKIQYVGTIYYYPLNKEDFDFTQTRCEEVGVVKRVHTLFGGVHRLATAIKVVEEVQEDVQEIKDE